MDVMDKGVARKLWIRAQKLDSAEPFGAGPQATTKAVEHLGYVQIDTINVIERCHHHILFNRIPSYTPRDLNQAQARDKSVFEYWTHALSYVPTKDFRFYLSEMKRRRHSPGKWLGVVKKTEMQKVMRLIKKGGALSIRDINDDVLVEKSHDWASRKPSKRALQLGFYTGRLVISERVGMLKKYELIERHFDWEQQPKAASEKDVQNYLLDRSLRSQGVVSLDSICHLDAKKKPEVRRVMDRRVKAGELMAVKVRGVEKVEHWVRPGLDSELDQERTHLLSPFDPLIIQRKRLAMLFDYQHLFEAYIPKEKRVYGYFALPVLIGDRIVAAIDLKADRAQKKLLLQKWTWLGKNKSASNKTKIEAELHRFESFQLG